MKDIDIATVGGRIRKARVDRGLSTRELAEQVDVTPNYLSVLERNDKNKQASPSLLRKLAETTGVSLEWLRSGTPAPVPAPSRVEKGLCADDVPLLLALIMQQGSGITKETVAAALKISTEIVDGILLGKAVYNPRWENAVLGLVRNLNLPATQKKVQNLMNLLQQEYEKEIYSTVPWVLQTYLEGKYKATFNLIGEPLMMKNTPRYILFELREEDNSQTWYILYYHLDDEEISEDSFEDVFEDILLQAKEEGLLMDHCMDKRINIGVAFSDESAYAKMEALYNKKKADKGLKEDCSGSEEHSPSRIDLPAIKLFHIADGELQDTTDLYGDDEPN